MLFSLLALMAKLCLSVGVGESLGGGEKTGGSFSTLDTEAMDRVRFTLALDRDRPLLLGELEDGGGS